MRVRAAQLDKVTCKQCVLSQQLVVLAVYGNLANEELAQSPYNICSSPYFLPAGTFVRTCKSTVLSHIFCENRTISVTFRASRFVDKLLRRITSENATLPIPMPRFIVIGLVVSDQWRVP